MAMGSVITLRHLNIFVSLYENKGNMTRTAESCFIAQPAISLALSEMEDYYGCRLFDRISRKLHINDAGTKFYGYAKRVLNLMEDMDRGMKDIGAYSTLRVGCCDSMDACGLPKYVTGYADIHPGVTVRSTVDTTESLISKILGNELDIAIIDKAPGSKQLVSEEFVASKLALGVSPALGFKEGDTVTARELAAMPLLLREKGCGTRQAFDQAMEEHGYQVEPLYESVGNGYAVNAAVSGMGIAVLPEKMMLRQRRHGSLVFLEASDLDIKITYHIIWHKDKDLSKNASDFVEMCRNFEVKAPDEEASEGSRAADNLFAASVARIAARIAGVRSAAVHPQTAAVSA